MNKAVLKHKIEKFVSDNISKIRKLHHNEFSTRKLKVNYTNRMRGKNTTKSTLSTQYLITYYTIFDNIAVEERQIYLPYNTNV
jgi:hypothetical protein